MSLLFESTLKVSLVVGLTLAVAAALRGRSASVRHFVLAAGISAGAMTPALIVLAPAWIVQFSWGVATDRDLFVGPASPEPLRILPPSGMSDAIPPQGLASFGAGDLTWLIVPVWLTGGAINLSTLLIGVLHLKRMASRARAAQSGRWIEISARISQLYGLHQPVRVLLSDHPSLLVTWGLLRPTLMLPVAAGEWPADRIQVVLSHELAHVRRRDWVVQMSGEVLRSVYWFNPLMWLACSRLRHESEQACDDAVVNLGIRGRDYATHLLDLARILGAQRRMWFPAQAIAPRPSSLERRIRAMLNDRLNRRPVTGLARIVTVVALVCVTVPIAAFGQNAFATLTGSIVDPTDAFLPAVSVVVTDNERRVRHEVQTDRTGRFEIVGLPPGDYVLEAELPGFKGFRERLTLDGQNVERNLQLSLGSLQETITVVDDGTVDSSGGFGAARARRPVPDCPAPGAGGMGGNIRQPRKIRHVHPQYPSQLRESKVEGIVLLEGLIGTSGFFDEVRVVNAAHPDLVEAAIAAVNQWEFDETLLNCRPVETPISVTVEFKSER